MDGGALLAVVAAVAANFTAASSLLWYDIYCSFL